MNTMHSDPEGRRAEQPSDWRETEEVHRAWPVARAVLLGLLCATAWYACFSSALKGPERRARAYRTYGSQWLAACRADLALRAVAIRRFAERTGQLPSSLADCAPDLARLDTLAVLSNCLTRVLKGPVHALTNIAMKAEQDVFGLPIVYHRGGPAAGDVLWVRSSDPLPPEVVQYLKAHGGLPAVAPEPFALSSLFLRDSGPLLRSLEREAFSIRCWLWGGLALITLVTLVAAVVCGHVGSPRSGPSVWTVIGALLVGAGVVMNSGTCYLPMRFSPRRFFLGEQLRLLNDAVQRREVSPEVAATAEKCLRNLWTPALR